MPTFLTTILDGFILLTQEALGGSIGAMAGILVQLVIFYVLFQVSYMIWRLMHEMWSPRLKPLSAPLHPNGQKVLIVGDSTARGTGAQKVEDTIAGRLRRDFPNVEIQNNSMNGAITKQVLPQLQKARDQKFDLVFVATGGNDIVYLSNMQHMRSALVVVLEEAIRLSNHRVIVLFYANFGSAPIFPPWILWFLRRRTRRVHAIFRDVCGELKVPCIELYTDFIDASFDPNFFANDPKRYYAKDFIHPSGDGYGLWYRRIWREMVESGFDSGLKN